MSFIDNFALQHWAFRFLAALFLVGGLTTFVVGMGLIVDSAATLQFLGAMNRWVSTRRMLGLFVGSGDPGRPVHKFQGWLAVVFVAGAAFAIVGLGTGFDARAVSVAFGLDTRPSSASLWLVESARWALIAGNLFAIAIVAGLAFFPETRAASQGRSGRWYSVRRLAKNANAMNMRLDGWVAASPRAAGWIITAAGLVLVGNLAIVLLKIR